MKKILLAAVGLLALGGAALAQPVVLPQVQSIGPNDVFQDIVNGQPQAGSFYASGALLGSAISSANDNALVGGDFGTNTFVHGTSVGTITTATKYTATDWFGWAGTSTTLTASQQTGASDIPLAFKASLRAARTGSGVVQTCVAQEVESIGSYRFQGQTTEFDFHALAGSGFSAAGSALTAYIVYGTGADEGSVNMAFGLNAGGGGSGGWTGQANAAAVSVPISTTWGRYSVIGVVPSTATEVGVALCWTPVGASPSNDYFEFTGAQLVTNNLLGALAATNANGVELAVNDGRARGFVRNKMVTEIAAQQRYAYAIADGAVTLRYGLCQATTTTAAICVIPLPETMRAAPTVTVTTAASFGVTVAAGTAGTCTTLAAVSAGNSPNAASVSCTTASTLAAGNAAEFIGAASGATNLVTASAEL